jgi:cyclophilin family peptidyl-prolyl cis-trans isomerase
MPTLYAGIALRKLVPMEGVAVMNSAMDNEFHRIFTLSLALLAVLAICGAGCKKESSPAQAAASPPTSGSASALPASGAKPINFEKPVVKLETSSGTITLTLDGVNAPGTVRNFLNYANEGFYDNTLVHYVDPGKMIVAGGYASDGTLKLGRTPIRNEAHSGLKNVRGTIAMTRDPDHIDSATTQFFINLVDAPQRDHAGDDAEKYGYCVFGTVTEGLEVAEKISQAPTANKGGDMLQTPDPPVVIKSVRVVQ